MSARQFGEQASDVEQRALILHPIILKEMLDTIESGTREEILEDAATITSEKIAAHEKHHLEHVEALQDLVDGANREILRLQPEITKRTSIRWFVGLSMVAILAFVLLSINHAL